MNGVTAVIASALPSARRAMRCSTARFARTDRRS